MANKIDLRDYIKDHLLIGDGAISTWLYQNGIPIGVCCEELCVSHPQRVKELHRTYYEAGARLIETNTFGANREALSHFGLEDQVYRINWNAAQLAREAVGEDAYVMGSITSVTGGRVRDAAMKEYSVRFREQMEALLAGEVDGLILETFLDLEELLLAVELARSLTNKTIIAQLACVEVGRTRDGYDLSEAFTHLSQKGADVVGLNCRLGPFEMLRSLENVVFDQLPLSVFPNAGRLGLSEDERAYTASPRYFAEQALFFRSEGARIIGGCCGTTPEHILELSNILQGLDPLPRINPTGLISQPTAERPVIRIASRNESIVDKVSVGPTVIVELDPPRDMNIDEYLKGAATLQKSGVDAITMADNSMAQARMSNLALGAIVSSKLGIDPLVHITCRDRNLLGQQSHLMGLDALGIHQVLVITGDPPRFGDVPGSSSVYDVSSFDLIRLVRQLNEGLSFSGKRLPQQGSFVIGAAFNPHVNNIDKAVIRLEKKIESGADFIMTQPVYDPETIRLVAGIAQKVNVPFFIGIMPLTSSRNAEYLHNEVPGITLSDAVRERMKKYSGEEAKQEGIIIAKELLDEAMAHFKGIYLITPFNNYEMTAALTKYIKEK